MPKFVNIKVINTQRNKLTYNLNQNLETQKLAYNL
jgi:hypothetical protein